MYLGYKEQNSIVHFLNIQLSLVSILLELTYFNSKKSRIRETKHLSTDADSSTDAIGGWTKNTPKPDFFEKGKNHPKRKNSKTSRTRRGSPVDDRPSPD